MVLVNIVAVLLLMQNATHLSNSKNLPHVMDLHGSTRFLLLRTDKYIK